VRVLIVEDETRIAHFLTRGLRGEGHEVEVVDNGDDALGAARRFAPEAVVLDLMLPGRDGVSVLRDLRALDPGLPIVILSARRDVSTKVAALRAGAADYMVKPFALDELLERLRLRAGAEEGRPSGSLRAGDLVLDTRRREVDAGAGSVALTDREFRLLEYLMLHQGEIVTRERLLSAVWGYSFVPHTNVVDVCIRRLRQKIGADRIATIRNGGYELWA
jgi:two-component system, OmpR family, copper resistance phosphate regulon response regulator CusR